MSKVVVSLLMFIIPVSQGIQNDELTKSIVKGKQIYEDFCVTCHKANGEGFGNLYPPLANSDYLLQKRKMSIRAIKSGLRGKIKVNGKNYDGVMQDFGLENGEVADVMNYILNSWGNKHPKTVTVDEVKSVVK
jgi:mono/diheme cytochrome c family protein